MRRVRGNLAAVADRAPVDFVPVLLTPGVGARTVQALAMVAEVVHGAPYRLSDPARFRSPMPARTATRFWFRSRSMRDDPGHEIRDPEGKTGRDEELQVLKRLDDQSRQLERRPLILTLRFHAE